MSEHHQHHDSYQRRHASRERDERERIGVGQSSASRRRSSSNPRPNSRGPRIVESDNRDYDETERVFVRAASPERRRYPPGPYDESDENVIYVEETRHNRSHRTNVEYSPPQPRPHIPVIVEGETSHRPPPAVDFGPPPVYYNPTEYGPGPGYFTASHLGPPPPPPPPPRATVIEGSRRSHGHHRHRTSRSPLHNARPVPRRRSHSPPPPPPPIRPVPVGYVRPAPLPPPPSRPPRIHEAELGARPVSGHDFINLASRSHPKKDPDMQGKVVLCVYRSHKRSYDYRTVDYVSERHKRIIDRDLFYNMKLRYEKDLRGWMRKFFSFKGLTSVRLLLYGHGLYFQAKQDDPLFSMIFMRIWRNPDNIEVLEEDSTRWIEWITNEKKQHRDLDIAIELIEDYIPERIVFFVGVGLVVVVGFTSAWLIEGGDPSYVSQVMSFALTFIAAVVALTTIWDHFDGGRSKEIKEQTRLVLPENIHMISKKPFDQLGNLDYQQEKHDPKGKKKEGT